MELQSTEINEIAKALSLAQAKLGGTEKDGKNPHFKSSYSTLQACLSVTREPLADNGLAIVQQLDTINDRHYVVTTLIHISGQWLRSYAQLIIEKPTCQGMGSAISYFRRYSLCALLGLFQEDDDANKASAPPKPEKKRDEATDEQYDDFLMKWHETYTQELLLDFIKTKSSISKMSPKAVVYANLEDELFKKNMQAFIKWKENN